MAQASVAHRRASARNAALAARQRRSKVLAIVLCLVLAALLVYELPHLLGRGGSSSMTAASSTATPSGTGLRTKRFLRILRGSRAVDPFADRTLADLDPRVAPGGGRDPFAAQLSRATAASTRASSTQLPQRIVIGTPGVHKHLVHGWIVILASIPVGRGHGSAVRFARGVHGLGAVSILNSSKRRPLRGGYWVVYAGPVGTLGRVSILAGRVHSAGYRTAYIRELYRYR
jgi:hypothetical protein